MTCRGRSSRGRSPGAGAASASRASSPARRGCSWPGSRTPARPATLFPRGSCACGGGLEQARDLGVVYSHQVSDLPEARAVLTQYDRHEVVCGCGARHRRGRPAGGGRWRAGHGDLRPGVPGVGRVPDGDAPRPRRAVRGHYRLHVRQPPCGRVGARPAGSRREGGGRRERADTGADRHRPRYLRRRDPRCGPGPGPKTSKKYLQVACTSLLTATSSAAGTCPRSGTSSTAACTAPSSCTTGTVTTTRSPASSTSCAVAHLQGY